MSTFDQVSVVIEANIYFDGKVSSRTIVFPDGSKKTLGLLLPGEYHFNTDAPEHMKITEGTIEYRLQESDDWKKVEAGGEFNLPGNSSFDIRALEIADYVCSFL
ncbi:MAG TPA: pyrimidine/purine nucleoside phosphorylase [Thiotrichaceae bacterium]|nr:pyrimidine/purine nucleoside phosphorylase [Thiotrichaceae bacterium]HIM08329.1 pyrimidine/purine nucleoside phosphorylase [Gammaproteobacteria bacterium]